MKIIIDILHPAHVHVFRNFIQEMQQRGHTILITARKKDVSIQLLDHYGFNYIKISDKAKKSYKLPIELLFRNFKFYKICKQFKPDILMGIMGPTIAIVGAFMSIPRYTFYDTETAKATNWFVYPLSTAVITPESYTRSVWGRHVTYKGNHELAYLHPQIYTPNASVLKELGLTKNEPYFLLRLVSWEASHDVGWRGFTDPVGFVKELSKQGRVIISSEVELPKELEPYHLKIAPHKIHDVMAFATLFIGESITMASESAVLGVPAIVVAQYGISYFDEEEEKYGLSFRFKEQEQALKKVKELLTNPHLQEEWQKKRKILLKDMIDVTQWFVSFIEKENKQQQELLQ